MSRPPHYNVTQGRTYAPPIDSVLERLEAVRRSGSGWSAKCPAHEDKWPSLSIAEGRDGRVLIFCHSGCPVDTVVGAIGLRVGDLFPRDDTPRRRPQGRRDSHKPAGMPKEAARKLLEAPDFPMTWRIAKTLALMPGPQARLEVLRRWRHYADRCDVGTLLATSYLIRGVAMFTRCTARGCDDLDVTRAVQRLVRDLEREVAA